MTLVLVVVVVVREKIEVRWELQVREHKRCVLLIALLLPLEPSASW